MDDTILTPAKLSALISEKLSKVERIDLQNKGITSMLDMAVCGKLHRLNLNHNKLVGIEVM